MLKQKPFWMVWRPGSNVPTQRHDTYLEASIEAARLTTKEHVPFYVLKAVTLYEPVTEIVEDES
jgi:hypothetical protein